jgi:hypothetical protein
MRHRTAALVTATTLMLTLGGTAAYATGDAAGSDAGGGKKPPAACGPDRPDGRLENALRDVKVALGANGGKLTDRIVAVFAKDMGLSRAEGRKVLEKIFSEGGPGPEKSGGKEGKGGSGSNGGKGSKPDPQEKGGPKAVFTAAQLSKALGISHARARVALDALQKLASGPKGSIDENGPAFAAIASRAGVTPQQLTKAIVGLKSAAGKAAGTKPGPCKKAGGKQGPGTGKPAGDKALTAG